MIDFSSSRLKDWRQKLSLILLMTLTTSYVFTQIVDPFSIRYQNQQKGGIRLLSNVSVSCTNCATTTAQMPPAGTGQNNGFNMSYVDVDGQTGTYMSSSDSLNLPNCSEVLWAGLYWGARVGGNGFAPTAVLNYSFRNQVRLRVNNGAYIPLTADEILDNTVGHQTYHCFKNITALVQASGINARYTLANIVTRTGTDNMYGGWTIVVVYKNVFESMRNLTVFDGLANVSAGNTVTVPISGFLTPPTGPVNFELGVVSHDGDRNQTGDQLQFNGVGTSYVNVSDALHNPNDVFNSTIARNAVLTPFRLPSFNNTLGHDASVFFPNNTALNYIGNNATSANIRITTGGETILTSVVTSVIDVFEPDLRATVYMQDLNGGLVQPGDILEYTLVGKNIGSDISNGTFMSDTLDPRTVYLPNSISINYGPNLGPKTDAYNDDQAEYDPVNRVIIARIGTGANATTGGVVVNSPTGADSTVVKFRVTVINDCLMFQCDPTLDHKAYIFGTGNISGNAYNNGGLSDLYDANGCPTVANNALVINVAGCPPAAIDYNDPLCVGENLQLTFPFSSAGIYTWIGPNNFVSTTQNPTVSNVTTAASGQYLVAVSFNGLDCIIDTTISVTVNPNPTIALNSITNVACSGVSTGAISITANGTAPYSYTWTGGNTTSNPTGLAVGNYSVTVTDANTCTATANYQITQPSTLTASAVATTNFSGFNVSCFGSTNGAASVTASGGVIPYTYLWGNGSTSATAVNLPAGSAPITVTDANGCIVNTSANLTQPTDITLSSTKVNVSCFGGVNGSIDLSVVGGVAPYTYAWSNTAVSQDLTGLASGTYTVTVTDANGCTETSTINITQPNAALSLTETHTNVLCFGQSTGAINMTPAGGTLPYTYAWSNNATTQDLTAIPSGTYTLQLTDANGCATSLSATVTQPAAALQVTNTAVNILCFGNATGSIDATVTGGTGAYTYLWNTTATSQDLQGVIAGTYTLTVTDGNACTASTSATLTQPTDITLSSTKVNVSCFGGANGSIDLSVAGGVPPYTYAWSNSAATQDLTGLAASAYTVTVTDANGCTETSTITITQPSAALSLTETHTNVLCFGQSTGAINMTPAGGTLPYTYAWSNNATTQDLSGIPSGTYTLQLTDANGCTTSLSATITQPAAALQVTNIPVNVACFGNTTGSIDVTVTGGTGAYTYLWNPNATTQDLLNVAAGTYSLTVTDANGCVAQTGPIVLTQPAAGLSATAVGDNVNCYGASDGGVNATVTGGTLPYSYSWSSGQTTEDLSSIPIGTYTLTVTDANGCVATTSITLTQPAAALSGSTVANQIACFGQLTGTIDATVSGGTVPYTYAWTSGQFTEDLSNQPAGNYGLTITDANGCVLTLNETITQPQGPLTITETHIDALCVGGQSGSIDLTVTGGTAPFVHSWNNFQTVQDISNLLAGTYICDVTDANNCTASISVTIVDPSNTIVLSIAPTNVSCFNGADGAFDLTVSGGNPGYTYLWSNQASTQDVLALTAGNYSVNVVDVLGCGSFITGTITQPATPIQATSTVQNVLCNGFSTGAIDMTIQGGVLPYSYAWNSGPVTEDLSGILAGTYILQVTDAAGCVFTSTQLVTQPATAISLSETHTNVSCFGGSNGAIDLTTTGGVGNFVYSWTATQVSQDISGLIAGNYSVNVTDGNGCLAQLTVSITQPSAALSLSQQITNVSCNGGANGAIDVTVTGGTTPYTFNWSNTAVSEDINGLTAGSYTLNVTDANGCTASITGVVTQPTVLTATSNPTPVSCNAGSNGTVVATPSGGTAPYTYNWSNGQTTALISGLTAGTYTCTITDANGCTVTTSATVLQPTQLSATTSQINVLCNGNSTGSVSVQATGGVPGYSYLWSTNGTGATITSVPAGTYVVTVTDANLCTTTVSATVTEPLAPISATLQVTDNSCFNGSIGAIDATVSGGVGPYQYMWSNSQQTQDITGLVAGNYQLMVTDANGCQLPVSAVVDQPDQITLVNSIVTNVSCFGGNNGAIDIAPTGGTSPYSYSWSTSQLTEDLTGLIIGSYTVTVFDANNCSNQFNFTITEPTQLVGTYSAVEPLCFGYSDGQLTGSASGGVSPYAYSWSNGPQTALNDQIPTGNYILIITDDNGCQVQVNAFLDEPEQLQVSYVVSDTVGCDPLTVQLTNTSPEQFSCFWNLDDGSTLNGCDVTYTYNNPGCYDVTLTVTSALGCSNFAQYNDIICVLPSPTAGLEASPEWLDSSDPSVEVTNTSSGAVSYVWDMGDGSEPITSFEPSTYTYPLYQLDEYTITQIVTAENGCTDTAVYTIEIDNDVLIYVPNAFTPDDDEYNQNFTPIISSLIVSYHLTIYNRWGEILFESYDKSVGWDGTYHNERVQDGVYVWEIVVSTDGTNKLVKNGHVTIIR